MRHHKTNALIRSDFEAGFDGAAGGGRTAFPAIGSWQLGQQPFAIGIAFVPQCLQVVII